MSAGTRRELRYIREEAFGVTPPSAAFNILRNTGGAGVSVTRSTLSSKEFRRDRALVSLRLGTNQGKLPVPFDLSFGSYDDLIEGALLNTWTAATGARTAAIGAVSVAVAAGPKTVTRASGSWLTDGFAVGDRVRFNNFANAGNNSVWFLITALSATVMTLGNSSALVTETLATGLSYDRKGGLPVQLGATTVAVDSAAKTFTRSAGSFITDGLSVGDYVTFGGFVNSGNNSPVKITTLTATVVTAAGATGLTTEAALANTRYISGTTVLKDGVDIQTFSFEDAQTDIGVFQLIAAALVNSMSLSVKANALVNGNFDVIAAKSGGVADVTNSGSTIAAPTTIAFDTFTGAITEGGVAIAYASGIDFTHANGIDLKYAIFNIDGFSAAASMVNLTGTLTAYFVDKTLLNKFLAETETSLTFTLTDLAGNSYIFSLPRIKYTATTKNVSEKDVSVSVQFTGLKDDVTNLCHISITKKPF